MELSEYLTKMKKIQNSILEIIEDDKPNNDFLHNLSNSHFLDIDNPFELIETLHLISKISNNHYRTQKFFDKIECIITLLKYKIQQYFSNFQIFNIFKTSKRILLFLFEEKIIHPDINIYNIIKSKEYEQKQYLSYFILEFKSFLNNSEMHKFNEINELTETDFDLFEKKRKIGENDSYICNLIRNDLVTEFITFVNRNNYSIRSQINSSIFETNPYLLNKNPNLIEYSAFFGSIQIFRYLTMNKVELTSSLWIYAIHGKNPEIFHFLEENKFELSDSATCLLESIKCHHIEFTNYIKDNLISNNDEEDLYDILSSVENDSAKNDSIKDELIFNESLKSFNYLYLQQSDFMAESVFYKLCKYDYCNLVHLFIKDTKLNVNLKHVLK